MEKGSEVSDRIQDLVRKASGCYPLMKDTHKLLAVMVFVGFTNEESKNRSLQMRVRRSMQQGPAFHLPSSVKVTGTPTSANKSDVTSPDISTTESQTAHSTPTDIVDEGNQKMPAADEDESTALSSAASANEEMKHQKKTRQTVHQAQEEQAAVNRAWKAEKQSFKRITTRITANQEKYTPGQDGYLSVASVVNEINELNNTNVSASTVSRYVRAGKINESPAKPGPKGLFNTEFRKLLLGAYISFLQLGQVNGKVQYTTKDMSCRIQACVKPAGFDINGRHYARKFESESADDFLIMQKNEQEKRRVEWATYNNFSVWL